MIYQAEHTILRPDYMGGGVWTLGDMTDVTVLMGKNGSGKSLLLRAWRDQAPDELHYVVPERTGDIRFQPAYLEEEFTGVVRRGVSVGNFVPEYRRRIVARVHTYFMKRGSHRGTDAPPASPSDLEQLVSLLVPDFDMEL
jgi:hypothetical protein